MMKNIIITLMLAIGVTSVVMATQGQHGQIVDWDQLNLSDNQEELVQTIRDDYKDQFQLVRKTPFDKAEKLQQYSTLRQTMVVKLQTVLTEEQKLKAGSLLVEKMEKRMQLKLQRLIKKLSLTSEQNVNLQQALTEKLTPIRDQLMQWDIPNTSDRQQLFDQLDQMMPALLSSDQLAQWQIIKQNRNQSLA
jgi:hypothetical protein